MALLQDGISGAIALPPPLAIIRAEVGVFPRTMKKIALQSKIGLRLADCHEMYLLNNSSGHAFQHLIYY